MASKFDKAKVTQGIKEVAQASNEQANLIMIKYYKDEDLVDYPKNNEDISNTEDIEKSIDEQGFTDPIEITDFGMPEGKFMILSGHRRRAAGRKKGIKKFPCILRHFKTEAEVYNYVLFANAHRDSAKDPLLFAKRYKMHEEYLKEIGFKGSIREEVARRLGFKPAQADRYNQMNKVILPVWDMIREGKVGMSSITDSGMYTHSPEEQEEILKIMKECLKDEGELTRPVVKQIVKGWREGKKSWLEVIQIEMDETINPSYNNGGSGVSVMSVNAEPTEPKETKEKESSPLDRNNEVNYDFSHREGLNGDTDPLIDERLTEEDKEAIEKAIQNEKKTSITEEEKLLVLGEKISKNISVLNDLLNGFYKFENDEKAESAMQTMSGLIKIIVAEMESIAIDYEKEKVFENVLIEIRNTIKSYEK